MSSNPYESPRANSESDPQLTRPGRLITWPVYASLGNLLLWHLFCFALWRLEGLQPDELFDLIVLACGLSYVACWIILIAARISSLVSRAWSASKTWDLYGPVVATLTLIVILIEIPYFL